MDKEYKVRVRIAGNTGAPCYFAIRSKGFEIEMNTYKLDDDWNCGYEYNATKDDLYFSSTTLESLLGLICMWECRGDNWKTTDSEWEEFSKARDDSPLYDEDGNLIEDE